MLHLSHKQVMTAVFLLATALGAYLVSGYVVSNDLVGVVGLVMLALPFAFLVVVLPMLRNWRTGRYVFPCWLLFEDIVRKYMGNNMAHILDGMRGDNQDTEALVSHQRPLRGRWGRLDDETGGT
jgi:hypothetical protein